MKTEKTIKPFFTFFAFAIFSLAACKKEKIDETMDCSGLTPGYGSDVVHIINTNCVSSGCHNAGSMNGDYTTYNGLKTIASNGELERRVVTNKTMPPGKQLSLEELKMLKCWINSGAPNN